MRDREGNRNARFLWKCRGCTRQFTVRIGSIFEDSKIPMRIWCHIFWRACSSKKGVSALQIQRETGLSYKSALFAMHRVRLAMVDDGAPKLSGVVESDEAFIGGKPRNSMSLRRMRKDPTVPVSHPEKTPIMALVERGVGGRVRARQLERVTKDTVGAALHELVERNAVIHTDEASHYRWLDKPWPGGHHSVNHSAGEYARNGVTTNTVEGFFSLVKRGVYGTFHSVSKRHLHRYLAEFEYRWNTRQMADGLRTAQAIRQSEGKRLRYKEPKAA